MLDARSLTRDARLEAVKLLEMGLDDCRLRRDRKAEILFLLALGKSWLALGEKTKALEHLQMAPPLLAAEGDHAGQARAFERLAFILRLLGQHERAVRYRESALKLRVAMGDRPGAAALLDRLGAHWMSLGNPRRALECHRLALPWRRSAGGPAKEAATLLRVGDCQAKLGQPQRAIEAFEAALGVSRASSRRLSEARALKRLGSAWAALGEPRRALDHLERSLQVRRAIGDRPGELTTVHRMAELHLALGDRRKAAECHAAALAVFEQTRDDAGAAGAKAALGEALADLGEPTRALELIERATFDHRRLDDTSEVARLLARTGELRAALGQREAAAAAALEAHFLFRHLGNGYRAATTMALLGKVWSDDDPSAAIRRLKTAARLFRDQGHRLGEARVRMDLGRRCRSCGARRTAISHYEAALALSQAAGDRALAAEALLAIGNVAGELGEWLRARNVFLLARRICGTVGDQAGRAEAQLGIGRSWAGLGEPEKALEQLKAALDAFGVIGGRRGQALALREMGAVWSARGEEAKAAECRRAASDLGAGDTEDPPPLPPSLRQHLELASLARKIIPHWRSRHGGWDEQSRLAMLRDARRLLRHWGWSDLATARPVVRWCLAQARLVLRERQGASSSYAAADVLRAAGEPSRARSPSDVVGLNLELLAAADRLPREGSLDPIWYRRRALSRLAFVAERSGDLDTAIGWLQELVGSRVADFSDSIRLGELLHLRGRSAEAGVHLERGVLRGKAQLADLDAREARLADSAVDYEPDQFEEFTICLGLALRAHQHLDAGQAVEGRASLAEAEPILSAPGVNDFEHRVRATWLEAAARLDLLDGRHDRSRQRMAEAQALRWRLLRGWPGNERYRLDQERSAALAAQLGAAARRGRPAAPEDLWSDFER